MPRFAIGSVWWAVEQDGHRVRRIRGGSIGGQVRAETEDSYYRLRYGVKLMAFSSPVSMAARYRSKSTVSSGVSVVMASRRAASVRPNSSNLALDEASALATMTSLLPWMSIAAVS